jgi:hypothetical protein
MSTSMPYPVQTNYQPAPQPPAMHWAIVLLLTIVTFTLFGFFWALRQALFVKKIDPTNPKAKVPIIQITASFVLALACGFIGMAAAMDSSGALAGLGSLVNLLHLFEWAFFAGASVLVRNALVERYGVKMNLVMTMIFSIFYVQHHMTQIAKLQLPLQTPGIGGAQVVGQQVQTRY